MATLQPEVVIRLQILSVALDLASRSTDGTAGSAAILTALPDSLGITPGSLNDHVKLLDRMGHTRGIFTMAGLAAVAVTPQGKDVAAQFERVRRDPVARMLQLEDDFLRWLYIAVDLEGERAEANHFLADGPGFLGVTYTAKEVTRVLQRLQDRDFVSEEVEPTDKGRLIVENGRSVRDASASPPISNVTHVTGSTNVSIGSSHVSQVALPAPWADDVNRLLDVIAQSLSALPSEIRDELSEVVADAREGAAAQEPSRVRGALVKIADFLSATASGALGGHLAVQIPQVVALITP